MLRLGYGGEKHNFRRKSWQFHIRRNGISFVNAREDEDAKCRRVADGTKKYEIWKFEIEAVEIKWDLFDRTYQVPCSVCLCHEPESLGWSAPLRLAGKILAARGPSAHVPSQRRLLLETSSPIIRYMYFLGSDLDVFVVTSNSGVALCTLLLSDSFNSVLHLELSNWSSTDTPFVQTKPIHFAYRLIVSILQITYTPFLNFIILLQPQPIGT